MVNSKISEWLKNNNIAELTSVQKKSIPLIISGKNVLITAPTGYGKTLAAILPVFELIAGKGEGLKILYIAPTKSLNRDIYKRIVDFAKFLGLRAEIRHGDTTSYERKKQSANPPNVLITTPESLQSMFLSEQMKTNLKSVKFVIVDEIHELLASKRGAQLSLGLERLQRFADYKRIGISATIADMNEVKKFLCNERECELVKITEPKETRIVVNKPNNSAANKELAKKAGVSVQLFNSILMMKELLSKSKKAIIFVNTRQQAEILSYSINKLFPELKLGLHHSSLAKKQRIMMEDELREGNLKAIIATSSMELGIDVGSIDLVIQFMSPRQVSKLVQRIGRSGHAYYKKSNGVILTINDDDYLESLAISSLLKKNYLEKPLIPKNSLDVLAHQIIGFLKDDSKITFEQLLNCINKSYSFRITEDELLDFLKFLEKLRYLKVSGKKMALENKSFYYYFESISTIPDLKTYKVISTETRARIGTLDESFVSQYCLPNSEIIMKGEPWQILEIKDDIISVARTKPSSAAVPSWTGELIPVSRKVALNVGRLRKRYYKDKIIPDSKLLYIEHYEDKIIINSCNGSRINEALSMALSSILGARTGYNIAAKADPYRIIFTLPKSFNFSSFRQIMNELKPQMINDLVRLSIKNSTIFHMRFFNVGQRFGIIQKGAEYIGARMASIVKAYEGTYIFRETMNEVIREKMNLYGAKKVMESSKIVYSIDNKLSIFAINGLNHGSFGGILLRGEDDFEVLELVKKRLMEKTFNFVCNNCKKELGNFQVQSFPYTKCPFCSAKTISFLEPNRERTEKMTNDTAELFLSYGIRACFAVAGYGVGVNNAKRVLYLNKSEDELIKDIIEEEKKFIRTRRFWQ
ncbi:MAG: DEAD/DEAH box helicase [Candidatus Nanoarchaeia archaeon]|jgi:ATP-dependent Lhr-like helicase